VLGGGIDVVTIGVRTYIRSVPGEFNMDKNKVMELAQQQSYISAGARAGSFVMHVCFACLLLIPNQGAL
jgi:ESCRT-II complex subunit VPS22